VARRERRHDYPDRDHDHGDDERTRQPPRHAAILEATMYPRTVTPTSTTICKTEDMETI
jgi:hypothetical protein